MNLEYITTRHKSVNGIIINSDPKRFLFLPDIRIATTENDYKNRLDQIHYIFNKLINKEHYKIRRDRLDRLHETCSRIVEDKENILTINSVVKSMSEFNGKNECIPINSFIKKPLSKNSYFRLFNEWKQIEYLSYSHYTIAEHINKILKYRLSKILIKKSISPGISLFLNKSDISEIIFFYLKGHILFPFCNLYYPSFNLLQLLPSSVSEVAFDILKKLNLSDLTATNFRFIKSTMIGIILSIKKIDGINSFTPKIIESCLSDVTFNNVFIKELLIEKQTAILRIIRELSSYFENSQYLEILGKSNKWFSYHHSPKHPHDSFTTESFGKIGKILINNNLKKIALLKKPTEFSNMKAFSHHIDDLCYPFLNRFCRVLPKNNLIMLCEYYDKGYILFPFYGLFSGTITSVKNNFRVKTIIHKYNKIIKSLGLLQNSGRHANDLSRLSSLIFQILLCTKGITSLDSFSIDLIRNLFSNIIIDCRFSEDFQGDKKRKTVRKFLELLEKATHNNQYLQLLLSKRVGPFKTLRSNLLANEFGKEWLDLEKGYYNMKNLKNPSNHYAQISLMYMALNNNKLLDFEQVFKVENLDRITRILLNDIIIHRKTNHSRWLSAKQIRDFFVYVADEKFRVKEGLDHEKKLLPGYCYPFKISVVNDLYAQISETRKSKPTQSRNQALPLKWIIKLKRILTMNNYEWPQKRFPQQWINWIDPDTQKEKRVWCPVICFIILAKIELPIRTIQIRFLDSGEGDIYKYNFKKNTWNLNDGQNAGHWEKTGASNHNRGVIKKIIDNDTGEIITGFYINTNKTQDRDRMHDEFSGYEMPWENMDAIKIFSDMRLWQEKYNPVSRPAKFIDLRKRCYCDVSEKIAKRIPSRFYLFRYPAGNDMQYYQSPPNNEQVSTFWLNLLAELELRLKKENPEYAESINIIKKWNENGQPTSTYFTLHGLRTAGLTAMAKANLPPYILSKILAGHSNIVMTYYYVIPGPAYITEHLNKAKKQILDKEQEEFKQFLSQQTLERANKIAHFNSDYLNLSWEDDRKRPFVWSDAANIGFCPKNQMECDVGGFKFLKYTSGQKSQSVHGPVPTMPNGKYDCARCRFFITGPPFLIPLIAKFNEASLWASKISKRHQEIIDLVDPLETEQAIAYEKGLIFDRNKVIKLESLNSEEILIAKQLDNIFNQVLSIFLCEIISCHF